MRQRRASRRAILLLELIAMILIGTVMLSLLARMIVNHLEFQHLSRLHDNRMAVMDSLIRRLERDAVTTAAYRWQDDAATLTLGQASAPAVQYRIQTASVVRRVDGIETDRWSSMRLRFSAKVERGPRADILGITFTEQPPPRRRRLPDRTYTKSVTLPSMAVVEESPEREP